MSKKKTSIPELRFPEFLNESEWKERKLGELADKVSEKNKDGLIYNVFTNSAIDGIVDQREYFDKDIANKNNLETYYIVKEGDYVYNPRISNIAPVGPISKNKTGKSGAMSPLYTVLRFANSDNGFYEYYFKTVHWYNAIRKAANTGARFDRMSVTDSVFMDISVLYPSPKEQQKIAHCLLSLDDVIAAHSQKLNLLKEHKKGLMQNLFPQEDENVPKYRFREFKSHGDWREKKLNEVCEVNPSNEGLPESFIYIDLESVDSGILKQKRHVIRDEAPSRAQRLLQKEDIIFQMVRPYQQNNYYFRPDDDSDYVASTGYAQLRPFESGLFLYQYIHSQIFLDRVLAKCTGSSYPAINSSDLSEISILIPAKIEEQQKIGACLSYLDEIIAAHAEKIGQLKSHQKGLMQGLFPKMND